MVPNGQATTRQTRTTLDESKGLSTAEEMKALGNHSAQKQKAKKKKKKKKKKEKRKKESKGKEERRKRKEGSDRRKQRNSSGCGNLLGVIAN